MDVGHYLIDDIHGQALAIVVGERITAIGVFCIGYRIRVEGQLCTVYRSVREGAVAIVGQYIAVAFQQIDDLIVNVSFVLDVGHYLIDDIHGQALAIVVGERITAIGVFCISDRIRVEGQLCTVYRSVREGSIAVVRQYIAVAFQQIDDFIVNVTFILDVGHHIVDDIHGQALPIVVGEGIGAVSVVRVAHRIRVEGQLRTVYRSVREGSIAVVRQYIAVAFQQIDDFIVNVTFILDVGHHIVDDIHGQALPIVVGEGIGAVSVVRVAHRIRVEGQLRTVYRSVREGSIAVVRQYIAVAFQEVDDLGIDIAFILDIGHHIVDDIYGQALPVVVGEGIGAVSVVGVAHRIRVEGQLCPINRRVREGAIAVVRQYIAVAFQQIDDFRIHIALVLDVGHYIIDDIHGQALAIVVGEGIGTVRIFCISDRVRIEGQLCSINRGVREGPIAVVRQHITVAFQQIDDLRIDIAFILDIGQYIVDHIYGQALAIVVGEGIGTVRIFCISDRVRIEGQLCSINRGVREGAIAVVRQYIAVAFQQIDDLRIDITFILDIGHHIVYYIYGQALPVVVGEGITAIGVFYKTGSVRIEGQLCSINRGVRERAIAVVRQYIAVAFQ